MIALIKYTSHIALMIFLVLCSGCVRYKPMLARIDVLGEDRLKEEYGDGRFYFFSSYWDFRKIENSREKFFEQAENFAKKLNECTAPEVYSETISNYSGRNYSVLVKCPPEFK